MPAQVIEIAPAQNETEVEVIKRLSSELPDEFTLFSNFYISYDNRSHEIDLFVVSPNVQVLIDVKGTTGRMAVDSQMWHPDNKRKPFPSPLKKLERHTRALKKLLADSHVSTANLWIEGLVVFPRLSEKPKPTKDAADDQNIREVLKRCVSIADAKALLVSDQLRPRRIKEPLTSRQLQGISQFLKKQIPPPRTEYNDWVIDERLKPVSASAIEDYSASHRNNKRAQFTLTRFPLLSCKDRLADIQTLQNQYQTLLSLRSYPHPNILPPEDAFFDEDDDALILVSPRVNGERLLSHCINEFHKNRMLCLSAIHQLLQGLAHLHKHQIAVRNLTPDSISIDEENTPRIVRFEGVGTVFERTITIQHHMPKTGEKGELQKTTKAYHRKFFDTNYMAPEGYVADKPPMDLFSAGIIFYQMLAGHHPFESQTRSDFINNDCSLPPLDDERLHQWLQTLTAHQSKNRFADAQEALIEFEKIFPELRR
jgi:serine/threonine protein kinase